MTQSYLKLRQDLQRRDRIFNLGYYTWVEQQNVPIEEFVARRDPAFWTETRTIVDEWDLRVAALNELTGALDAVGRPEEASS